jgi:hypothetical protein
MESRVRGLGFFSLSLILTLIFILFIAVVIISTTAFAVFGDSNKISNLDSAEIYGIDALDYINLASLSSKYESNGNPGTIANNAGDYGGKSYGTFQFAVNVGSLNSFLDWLRNVDEKLYSRLNRAKERDGGYGSNFDSVWRSIAKEDEEYFFTLQYNYVKKVYFDVVIDYFKKDGIDYAKRSYSLQNVIWSLSVLHGSYGAINIIRKIDIELNDDLSDDERFIRALYEERRKVNIYFASSSQSIKNSVYNRFINEEKDDLAMLKSELEN